MNCVARRTTYPINACWSCPRSFTLTLADAASVSPRSLLHARLRAWIGSQSCEMDDDALNHLLIGVQGIRMCTEDRPAFVLHDAQRAEELISLDMQSLACVCGVRVSVYDINFEECMSLSCSCGRYLCAVCGTQSATSEASHDHVRMFHTEDLFMTPKDYFALQVLRAQALVVSSCWYLDVDVNSMWLMLRDGFRSLMQRAGDALDRDVQRSLASLQCPLESVMKCSWLSTLTSTLYSLRASPAQNCAVLARLMPSPEETDHMDDFEFLQMGGGSVLGFLVQYSAGSNVFEHADLLQVIVRSSAAVAEVAETDAQLAMQSVPYAVLAALESVVSRTPAPRPNTLGWMSWTRMACELLSMSPLHARAALRDVFMTWRLLLRQQRFPLSRALMDRVGCGAMTHDVLERAAESDEEAVQFWFALHRPLVTSEAVLDRFVRVCVGEASGSNGSLFMQSVVALQENDAVSRVTDRATFHARLLQYGDLVHPFARLDAAVQSEPEPLRVALTLLYDKPRGTYASLRLSDVVVARVQQASESSLQASIGMAASIRLRMLTALLVCRDGCVRQCSASVWDMFSSKEALGALRAVHRSLGVDRKLQWRWLVSASGVLDMYVKMQESEG